MLFFNTKLNRTAVSAAITVALLTACGGQSTTDSGSSSPQKTTQTVTSQAAQTTQSSQSSDLLAGLAMTYPNGQLPAANAAQAAKELAQNPAALKITAQSAPIAAQNSLSAQSTNAPIQAQATSADYKAVTRIQNTTLTGAYFFTIYDTEQAAALAGNPNWRLEGPAFWASLASGTGLSPVHRFRNNINGSYLYTIYETEKADIQANYAATFFYEGVAWYAQQSTGAGWSPLYRFRNLLNGTYLFSAFEAEKDAIVANYSAVFKLEGVAYYVRQDAPAACTAAATASTGYSLVFKGCSADNVATYYDKTECVRDNASGLIWQGQDPAGVDSIRANYLTYTNFDSTTGLQKEIFVNNTSTNTFVTPTQSEINAPTNAIGFKNAVNGTNLCGSTAWRLPTRDELLGIVKTSEYPTINNLWFPNTVTYGYWTSSLNPSITRYDSVGWSVYFYFGGSIGDSRNARISVRLVH